MLSRLELQLLSKSDNTYSIYVSTFKKHPSVYNIRSHHTLQRIIDLFSDFEVLETYSYAKNNITEKDRLDDIYLINKKYKVVIYATYQSNNNYHIKLLYYKTIPKEIYDRVSEIKATDDKSMDYIFYVTNSNGSIELDIMEYERKKVDIKDNYNDDFYEVDENIKSSLRETKAGIHIFYGTPGTGKSTYIKHLISEIDKRFIYCPSSLVPQLANPAFISLLSNRCRNGIFIIEDAEEVLAADGSGRNSAISNVLNISDGILGDALNIQIIATFNTEFNNLDPAILRKGRLLSMYEFNKLDISKAQKILESLGINETIKEPMTLADIYNYANKDWYIKETKRIGL